MVKLELAAIGASILSLVGETSAFTQSTLFRQPSLSTRDAKPPHPTTSPIALFKDRHGPVVQPGVVKHISTQLNFQPRRHLAESKFLGQPGLTRTKRTQLNSAALLTAAIASVDAFWKNSPYLAAAIFCGIKASVADWVAQSRDYKKRADEIREEAGDDLPPEGTKSLVLWEEEELPEKKTDITRNICYILYG
jgi:hypothetical protein